MKVRDRYQWTLAASYIGYVVQAVVNNFAPLLFLTFRSAYGVSLESIALLVSVNFGIQLLIDLLSAKFVDKLGYRFCIVTAHVCSAAGLICLALLPRMMAAPFWGLVIAVSLYAVGGGLIEVLVSPIVEACPTDRKSAAMSLLHSFYCWGHVFVILVSTGFFLLFGIENWHFLCLIWALLPICNGILFARVPIARLTEAGDGMKVGQLFRLRAFWILLILMVCAGASEQAMSQWASSFAEAGLGVTKAVGDLAGPCLFAVLMGTARVLYSRISERVSLERAMVASGLLCVVSYLLTIVSPYPVPALIGCGLCGFSVGIMWPGTFSIAAGAFPAGGTAMFALMALAGDLGCLSGPAVAGLVSGACGEDLKAGFLAALLFPLLLIAGIFLFRRLRRLGRLS